MSEEAKAPKKAYLISKIQKLKPKLTAMVLCGSYEEGYLDALNDVLKMLRK